MPDRADYTVTPEQITKFMYSEQPISVSELTKRLNALVDPLYVQELKRGVITDWLTEIGMLSDNIVNNKARKRPTAAGQNIGIITELFYFHLLLILIPLSYSNMYMIKQKLIL